MSLHFTPAEFATRRAATAAELARRGLDGLLMFRQESMYYLTGYDTFGYVFFQCLYLGADGETLTLLTRVPDLRQAQQTSVIKDIRIWYDKEGVNPAEDLRAMLDEHGCRGKKLGIELEAYGLTGRNCLRVYAALENFCHLEDASDLVTRQRLIKSESELNYVRRAAELADNALVEANRLAVPGQFEGEILAAMQGEVFKGGGDYPGNEYIIGSGKRALLVRYSAGMETLGQNDQLTLEFAGAYRHYHACLMRTILTGKPDPRQLDMHKACVEAMLAAQAALKVGQPIGEVDEAHRRVLDAAGYQEHRLSACGYSLGTTFSPNWMDWPMLYSGNPMLAAPGMVFFIHIILSDSVANMAMTLGRTVLVTENGLEQLSKMPLDLIIN